MTYASFFQSLVFPVCIGVRQRGRLDSGGSRGCLGQKDYGDFSQPVEVPGYVLQPGKYVMKLVDFPSDRHVVQFMNERGNHVYAAAMAIPAYRTGGYGPDRNHFL